MNATLKLIAYSAVKNLEASGLTIATAESCTGGLIATAITSVPGASAVFRYGWITYCDEAKERELGVPGSVIEEHGVVSEAVVAAMAEGAMRKAGADIAIAVSGNAGPTAAKGEPPVGTVCLAIMRRGATRCLHTETLHLPGMNREDVRAQVAARVLTHVAGIAAEGN